MKEGERFHPSVEQIGDDIIKLASEGILKRTGGAFALKV